MTSESTGSARVRIAELRKLDQEATEGPWFYRENAHGGLGPNHDQERVYAVEICGDGRCRDGSRWRPGLKRWSSRIVAVIRDWAQWTDHPANRDLIVETRNDLPALLDCAEALLEMMQYASLEEATANGLRSEWINADAALARLAGGKEQK